MSEGLLDGRRGDISLRSGEAVGLRARDRTLSVRYPDFSGQIVFLVLRESGGAQRHVTDGGWSSEPYWIEAERFRQNGSMLQIGLPSRIVAAIPTGTLMKIGVSADADGFDVLGEFEWRLDDISNREATEPVDQAKLRAARARAAASSGRRGANAGQTSSEQSFGAGGARPSTTPIQERSPAPAPENYAETSQQVSAPAAAEKRGRGLVVALLFLVLLGGAGGLGYFFFVKTGAVPDLPLASGTSDDGDGSVAETPSGGTGAQQVAQTDETPQLSDIPARLGDAPEEQRASVQLALDSATYVPEQSYAIAQAWRADGGGNEAYLIFWSLAGGGHAGAALALAEMYDPLLHDPGVSELVSASEIDAMCWYGKAVANANASGAAEVASAALARRDSLMDSLKSSAGDAAANAAAIIDNPDNCLF